jgi:hypothetical protein
LGYANLSVVIAWDMRKVYSQHGMSFVFLSFVIFDHWKDWCYSAIWVYLAITTWQSSFYWIVKQIGKHKFLYEANIYWTCVFIEMITWSDLNVLQWKQYISSWVQINYDLKLRCLDE